MRQMRGLAWPWEKARRVAVNAELSLVIPLAVGLHLPMVFGTPRSLATSSAVRRVPVTSPMLKPPMTARRRVLRQASQPIRPVREAMPTPARATAAVAKPTSLPRRSMRAVRCCTSAVSYAILAARISTGSGIATDYRRFPPRRGLGGSMRPRRLRPDDGRPAAARRGSAPPGPRGGPCRVRCGARRARRRSSRRRGASGDPGP